MAAQQVAMPQPGWEDRSKAVQKSEDKLREAMKLIEQAQQCVRDAEELIIPYMGLITHRIACNVFSHAIDSVLFEHRRAVNVLIGHDRPVAIGSAPEHHI